MTGYSLFEYDLRRGCECGGSMGGHARENRYKRCNSCRTRKPNLLYASLT